MKLSRYLTKHNITSESFADRIGMSVSSVQKYRRGAKTPRPDVVNRIRKATRGRVKPEDWYSK